MLGIIKKQLVKIIQDIDAGNSNITEEEAIKFIPILQDLTNRDKRLSKYEACRYLNVSKSTFDNYVRASKLPRGKHQMGFKELSWSQKDLDKFIQEAKKDEKDQ